MHITHRIRDIQFAQTGNRDDVTGLRFGDFAKATRSRTVRFPTDRTATLLDVARALLDEFPKLVFIVAGEGPDAERLQAKGRALGLGDHLRFPGNLDRRTALLDCYRAGDVFVFASPTETQGLVLIEAMALGVPVVSTAVMGTETVLRQARGARISPEHVHTFAGHVAV